MLTFQLPANEKAQVTINPNGPVTDVQWDTQGAPLFVGLSNSDKTAIFTPQGPQGSFQIIVRANAGHAILEEFLQIDVISPEASQLNAALDGISSV